MAADSMSLERIDRLLVPLLSVKSDDERAREIERIVRDTRSIVEDSIRRYSASEWNLTEADADEIRAIVTFRFVRRLGVVSVEAAEPPILNLDDYVTKLTYNAINDYLRTRFPVRARLKSRIRYFLNHHPDFTIWTTYAGSTAGLAAWKNRADVIENIEIARADANPAIHDEKHPQLALHALLELCGGPVRLDAIVDVLLVLWRSESPMRRETTEGEGAAAEHEMRDYLQTLWEEVLLLPPRQRAALLLNLRVPEGVDAVSLLMMTGVASIAEIAGAVDMTADELAELWNDLPLSDNDIAKRLSISRQGVINLRKSARERLARRMAKRGQPR